MTLGMNRARPLFAGIVAQYWGNPLHRPFEVHVVLMVVGLACVLIARETVRAMRKEGLPLQRLMSNQALSTIAAELHQGDVSALFAAVGEGRISAASIVRRLVAAAGGVDGAADDVAALRNRQPAQRPARGCVAR